MAVASHCKICQTECQLYQANLSDDRYGYPELFSVYRCPQCGFGQLSPEVSADQLENLYTKYYPRKELSVAGIKAGVDADSHWRSRFRRWRTGSPSIFVPYVRAGQRVLDVGCGDGASLLTIQARGGQAYGTEFDHNVAKPAAALGLSIHFGDIHTIPQPDHSFDVITLNQLLEHVSDPIQFIQQVKQKLKSTGSIIITTPHFNSAQQKLSRHWWINWHVPFHVNFFTVASLHRLAQAAGCTITTLKTFTPQTWVILQTMSWLKPWRQVGRPNPQWHSRPANISLWSYLKQLGPAMVMRLVIAHSWGKLSAPLYRVLDRLHCGDSFLVILRPTDL